MMMQKKKLRKEKQLEFKSSTEPAVSITSCPFSLHLDQKLVSQQNTLDVHKVSDMGYMR